MPVGEFTYKRQIPNTTVKKLWQKQYPQSKQPKISMYELTKTAFEKTIRKTKKAGAIDVSKQEYGHKIPATKVLAATLKTNRDYMVIFREGHNLQQVASHEFNHINELREKKGGEK